MGTATIMPTSPNIDPKIDRASRSETGCKPTELPTSFGVKKLPSISWPKTKIPITNKIVFQSPQNCTVDKPIAIIPPKMAPRYGIKVNNPANTPITSPNSKPKNISATA